MSKPNTLEITIANRTIIRVLGMVLLSLLFLAALQRASHALVLLFSAFFLALALNAPVHWIASKLPGKQKGSRKWGTALSFVLVVLFLAGFLASIVPPLVKQTSTFFDAAPSIVQNVQGENSAVGEFVRKYNLEDQVEKFSSQLSDRLGNITGSAVDGVSRLTSSVFSVLTILVLAFMMLI